MPLRACCARWGMSVLRSGSKRGGLLGEENGPTVCEQQHVSTLNLYLIYQLATGSDEIPSIRTPPYLPNYIRLRKTFRALEE